MTRTVVPIEDQTPLRDDVAVPAAYKRTEAGVIPRDWVCTLFGSVIDLLTGYPFSSKRYRDSGIRLVRGSNVKRGVFDWADDLTQYWPTVTADIMRYELREGDLVVAMDGALVGSSYAVVSRRDLPCLLLQRVARIRSRTVYQSLLKYHIGSDAFLAYVDSVKTQTAIPHISPADIRAFAVGLPASAEEQRAIAAALGDADALISALDKLIAKKRLIKLATMDALLTGRIRLCGYGRAHPSYRWTPLGEIPADWQYLTVGQLVAKGGSIKTGPFGTLLKASEYSTEGTPVISVAQIGDGSLVITDDTPLVPPKVTRRLPEYLLRKGDIVFGRKGAVGRSALVKAQEDGCFLGSDGIRLRLPNDIQPEFVSYQLQIGSLRRWLLANAVGTTMPSLNQKLLTRVSLALPNPPEQRNITRILCNVDSEIAALERCRDKANAIKQGMMQALLSGRVRLVKSEAAA
jgi:type I restriction enzyme S subunit